MKTQNTVSDQDRKVAYALNQVSALLNNEWARVRDSGPAQRNWVRKQARGIFEALMPEDPVGVSQCLKDLSMGDLE